MKKTLLFTSALLCLASFTLHAQDKIEIKASPSALVSSEESKGTVFHVTVPENSTIIATVYGGDTMLSVHDGSSEVAGERSNNSAIFKVRKPGQYAMSAVTKCGEAFSIVANVLPSKSEGAQIEQYMPKVAIQGKGCAEVSGDKD
ncbi:hypothetical protein CW735_09070 [Alteromonas sp. MB-3u-76]|uniref:hypothetical protein n=1 Tax=Alteromonas sp. MB-3u-76 TaxID=2058133 RepID=UPI000C30BD30|nr:hypothetical protein [Alteromonas sp. MB-3u-76]AUC88322.1 hypothetical protein CW735_09070 [Alteromonas sp. MB-3u-76]